MNINHVVISHTREANGMYHVAVFPADHSANTYFCLYIYRMVDLMRMMAVLNPEHITFRLPENFSRVA